ncbi:MAG: hypothetical protein KME12_23530 [Trichocoleus desertorum ATA4-8-CV12]|jgi:hypothetical protein|nr:hypothetical protein [Trichocoleus desertorum ATA4-8-CV12]
MTTGREECAGMLARLAELIQMYEDPEAKETLVKAQSLLQGAIANASEAEAVVMVRLFQECLDKRSSQ